SVRRRLGGTAAVVGAGSGRVAGQPSSEEQAADPRRALPGGSLSNGSQPAQRSPQQARPGGLDRRARDPSSRLAARGSVEPAGGSRLPPLPAGDGPLPSAPEEGGGSPVRPHHRSVEPAASAVLLRPDLDLLRGRREL